MAPQCIPSFFATAIPITIPVGTSSTGVSINLVIDTFGATSCVAVQLNAPDEENNYHNFNSFPNVNNSSVFKMRFVHFSAFSLTTFI